MQRKDLQSAADATPPRIVKATGVPEQVLPLRRHRLERQRLRQQPRYIRPCIVLLATAGVALCSLVTAVYLLPQKKVDLTDLDVHAHHHEKGRDSTSFVFPSVEERVKYYMGSWYNRSLAATELDCSLFRYYAKGMPSMDHPYLFDESNLQSFASSSKEKTILYKGYVQDYYMKIAPSDFLMIAMFGDKARNPPFPMVAKARKLIASTNQRESTSIVGYFSMKRHYDKYLERVENIHLPWEEKKEILIWRGTSSGHGKRLEVVQAHLHSNPLDIDIRFHELTKSLQRDVENQKLLGHKTSINDLLHYKYLLSLEGNDVSTGLKWMLYSNSVVFMPPPTTVSWAMEDLLVPFYHYIPVEPGGSNLLEMVQWARAHDEECQRISQQATQYMNDLWTSKQAKRDNQRILEKTLTKYHHQFHSALDSCRPAP